MIKISKIIASMVVLAAMLTIAGCKKDELPEGGSELPPSIEINPEYVPIDWDNAQVVSPAGDTSGVYIIHFDGDVPDIHPGSIISIDCDTMVYHRFVTSANVNGNTVTVNSVEAYLTDIFSNTGFTLATSPASKSTAKGAVFYPVKAWQIDKYGQKKTVKISCKNDDETHFTHNIWSDDRALTWYNKTLLSTEHFSVKMRELCIGVDFDLEMYMNFSGRTVREVLSNGMERYRSKALNVNSYANGEFDIKQTFSFEGSASVSYDLGYDIWYHNVFEPIYVAFMVGPVPIVLKFNCDLFREAEVSSEAKLSVVLAYRHIIKGRMGFEWRQGENMTVIANLTNDFDPYTPELEGRLGVQAKAGVFPRLRVLVYGFLGPSFDIKPFLSASVNGGYDVNLANTSVNSCAWNFNCKVGLALSCGLSLQCIGYEIENWSTDDWNVVDATLYHSPERITYASGRPEPNQSNQVSFYVFDKNHVLNTEVLTCLPQYVMFEANGQLSSRDSIANNGIVQVSWTPSSPDDFLSATLYDVEGHIISRDTVHVAGWTQPVINWVDLGLPSGTLWAPYNVGANSPGEFGDYFAWGETHPKNYYDRLNFGYCYNGLLTRYCSNAAYGYNGYSDNLTVLMYGDDAATANWGGSARTPTITEWMELFQYTNKTCTTSNGIFGYRYTGSNGASIFLPACGWKVDGETNDVGDDGSYWSSSLNTVTPINAWSVDLYYDGDSDISWGRFHGFSVRPVRSPSKK